MKIAFCTTNKSKFIEVRDVLLEFGIDLEHVEMEIPESYALNQTDISEEKAVYAWEKLKIPCVADDTGVYFDAYPDFPGVISKFFIKRVGIAGIKKLLADVSQSATFVTVASYCDGNGVRSFRGECPGRIDFAENKTGSSLLYDTIFSPDGSGKSFNQLTIEEKNMFSHRSKAFRELAAFVVEKCLLSNQSTS